ncbi:MAG: AAA family ATPase, partial [Candidatus Aenigmarchaeota archaeon]|nr:AAA family ATPase [Candidatus Aenigmarchaeota archaeon]
MEKENIIEKFVEFLREEYYNDLVNTVSEGKKSIYIDFSLLDRFDPELADYLLENPEEVLELAEEAIRHIDLPGEAKL